MGDYVQVQTAIPSRQKGLEIARSVIDARLAACAQVIGPIVSTYRWKGEVRVDEEYLLLMKAPADRYADLEAHVHRLHSYSVAEIISTPINSGLASYLTWMDEETRAPGA
ncbi:divalent-cation tolerance protein CutA [Actinomadura roseirufa]|uniref:divalent-cation tolerance protein CutA n=1 Tax=Actinomadura roseirufa TaxID=2094049 RepID=UPI0010410D37|nr:divalent-cation tolerance protein CutA [Actinomadura roseirufa]